MQLRVRIVLLAAAVMLSAGLAEAKKTVPVFKDGQAQVVEGFNDPEKWIVEDLFVETEFDSDGDGKLDRVHVDVTRQEQTETEGLKVPVVYNTSPYFGGTARPVHGFMWNTRIELGVKPEQRPEAPSIEQKTDRPVITKGHVKDWVPRGYAVVHSSSPGTGLSQGSPTIGGDNESLAPKAVVDWLNGRAKGYTTVDGDEEVKAYWSTGKVGMTGTSFNGTLPVACATTGVEGLEAIIPVAPNTSYYHYYRSNGLVRSPGGYMGEDIDVLYDFVHSGYPDSRDYANENVRDKEMAEGRDRKTGDYNEFWAGRDYLNKMDNWKAALLMSHAFNDWNVMPEHSVRIYEAAKAKGIPCQAYFHQGGHGGPPPIEQMNRWFTRYLFGVENGVENDPKGWVVRENADRLKPTPYADYPNPAAKDVTFYMLGGAPERGQLVTAKPAKQGVETVVDNFSFDGKTLAKAEWTDHRLMFVTPTLTEDLHISGTPKIKIRVASSKPAVNLSVWVVSLPWNDSKTAKITDNIITRGWADPQNHKSLTESEPLELGKFYELSFDLQPDDQVIPAGQQIGLMIFSTDHDFTLSPDPGTELSVDLDATTLTLPIVDGKKAFEKATK